MHPYRSNLLLLADYLENEVHDIEYDHSTYGSGGEFAACALGHAYRSELFPDLENKTADEVFGPGTYDSVFNYYCGVHSRWDAIKKLRELAATYPDEGEDDEIFPPPASVIWERFKAEAVRLLARVLRPLG